MADLFPLRVILHFPPEVYLSRGVGDLCPLLVRALHANKISALQFLRGGRVRVTVREPIFREELLSNDFVYEGRKIPVTPAGVHTVTVHVRDLPVELSDDSIKFAFPSFGEVFSISHAHFKDFPELRNGNRLLLMSVSNPIPSSFNVLGLSVAPGTLVNLFTVPSVKNLIICPGPVPSRACAGAARSPAMWPVSVGRLGASLVLRPLLLLLFQLILFLLLVPRLTGTCPLSPWSILILILLLLLLIQFLFRRIRFLLLMIFLVDLVPSILNVFRPSQLPFRFLRLKYLSFQSPNLSLFVSKYCLL